MWTCHIKWISQVIRVHLGKVYVCVPEFIIRKGLVNFE